MNESVESNVTLPLLFQEGRKKKAMSVKEVLEFCQIRDGKLDERIKG